MACICKNPTSLMTVDDSSALRRWDTLLYGKGLRATACARLGIPRTCNTHLTALLKHLLTLALLDLRQQQPLSRRPVTRRGICTGGESCR